MFGGLRERGASARALACALVFTASAPAAAQLQEPLLGTEFRPSADRGRNVSVLERERPEYEAVGIRTGGFTLYPRVEAGIGYSDNVYGLRLDKVDDAFVAANPSLAVESNWGTHALTLYAAGRFRRFFSEEPKNENGFSLLADGRLDIDRLTTYSTGIAHEKFYEPRTSGSFPADALASVPFYRSKVYGRLARQTGRIRMIAAADVTSLKFDNVPAIGGGTLIQNDRDRYAARGTLRGDYAFTPDASAFGQVSYASIEYDRPLAIGLANRDGDELRLIGGVNFDLTALIRGEFGAGYVRRSYDSPIYPDISGLAAEARFEYFPSALTTVSAALRRTVEDSNIVGSGGYFATSARLGIDHELLRNLLLNARAEYENDDYQGVARNDDIYALGGGARYLVSRTLGFALDLSYVSRRSDDTRFGLEYDEVRGTVSIVVQR